MLVLEAELHAMKKAYKSFGNVQTVFAVDSN
jgi:hypothetical protein